MGDLELVENREEKLVPGVGVEPLEALNSQKLLIPRYARIARIAQVA